MVKKGLSYMKTVLEICIELFVSSFAAAAVMLVVVTSTNGNIYGVPFALLLGAATGAIHFVLVCLKKARGKLSDTYIRTYFLVVAGAFLLTTVLFMVAGSSLLHPAMTVLTVLAAPLYPAVILMTLMGDAYCVMITVGAVWQFPLLWSCCWQSVGICLTGSACSPFVPAFVWLLILVPTTTNTRAKVTALNI